MTKKRIAALICAATVLLAAVSAAVGFIILCSGAARLEGDTSREVSLTVNADRNGNVLDSFPLIRFDSAEDAAAQGPKAAEQMNLLWEYAQRQLDVIRTTPEAPFSEAQLAGIEKALGPSVIRLEVIASDYLEFFSTIRTGYGYAISYRTGVIRGGTLVSIAASVELRDAGAQMMTFALNARDLTAEVLSERSNRAALILIPLILLAAGGTVLILSMREYDKKTMLAAAEKTLFSAASQGLTKPLADIKRTCGAALGGDAADLQAMYDDILELNDEVLRLLAQARKS